MKNHLRLLVVVSIVAAVAACSSNESIGITTAATDSAGITDPANGFEEPAHPPAEEPPIVAQEDYYLAG